MAAFLRCCFRPATPEPTHTEQHGEDGSVTHKWTLPDGTVHRTGDAAIWKWNREGILVYKEWVVFGKVHCETEAAQQIWNDRGILVCASWVRNNKWDRADGPAKQSWSDAGVLTHSGWYRKGKLYRKDGKPPYEMWTDDGQPIPIDPPQGTLSRLMAWVSSSR